MIGVEEPQPRNRRAALEVLLARLTGSVGREANLSAIRRALAQAESEGPTGADEDYAQVIVTARLLGVRLVPTEEATAGVMARVYRGAPVIGWLPGGQPEWQLVIDREGRRVRLATTRNDADDVWISPAELARPDATGAHRRWLYAQPVSPVEPIEANDDDPDHGGQGGGGGHGHGHHGHGHGPDPLTRLWRMLWPEWRDIWVVFLFALGVGILSLATPIAVDSIITSVKGGIAMRTQVIVLALILLFCLGLAACMRALSNYVVELIQQRFFVRVVADLTHRLPRVSLAAFDHQNGPELVNRFFDVLTVQKAGAVLLLDGVSVVVQATVGLIVLGFYHPFLLGFDIGLMAAVAFIVFVLGRGAVASSIQESLAKYGVAGWMQEMVRHPRTFKDGNGQEYAMERADALARDYLIARQRHFRILFRQVLFSLALQAIASATLLGLGGWLVIPDETGRSALDVGQLVAAELILVVIVGSIVKLGKSLESYYDLMAAVDKLGHLLDLPLERDTGETHPNRGPAAVRMRDLSYGYDNHGHARAVLSGLNATIPAGARVAIVGPSGSGKSTLAELLYGLREPRHGRIEIDGVDQRDIRLDVLRKQVALVSAMEVIDGTLMENVLLGRHWYGLAEVRAVLQCVGLLEDTQRLPHGLHTRLTGAGQPLSLGQARRLLLARAILGQPRLLILDESIDELDEETRTKVLDVILNPEAPWTLLIVTHREDVASRCTQRLVLKHHTGHDHHEGNP